jgi:hypothetical protein
MLPGFGARTPPYETPVKHLHLTDWITIRGSFASNAGIATVTQGEPYWLDVSEYDDLVGYVEVREVTGTVTLNFQTAPSKDEVTFQSVGSLVVTTALVQTGAVLSKYATIPIARYFRWQAVGVGAPYDATFRIFLGVS